MSKQRATARPTGPSSAGDAVQDALLDRRLVVVHQRPTRLWNKTYTREFALFDEFGVPIGAVRQVRRNPFGQPRLARTFHVFDDQAVLQLTATRPRELVTSRLVIDDGAGNRVGEVAQRNVMTKIGFGFEVDGGDIGELVAESWMMWNIAINDADGAKIGRLSKAFEGPLRDRFNSAEHHLFQMDETLSDPLRTLAFASGVLYHLTLSETASGFNGGCLAAWPF